MLKQCHLHLPVLGRSLLIQAQEPQGVLAENILLCLGFQRQSQELVLRQLESIGVGAKHDLFGPSSTSHEGNCGRIQILRIIS